LRSWGEKRMCVPTKTGFTHPRKKGRAEVGGGGGGKHYGEEDTLTRVVYNGAGGGKLFD